MGEKKEYRNKAIAVRLSPNYIPRASLVVLAGTPASFSIPVSAVALILSLDAVMDMACSATNVVGNCLATAVMARMEGEQLAQPAAVVRTEMI